MAKNLRIAADDLRRKSLTVIELDLSPGSLVRGPKYHFKKFGRVLSSLWVAITRGYKCGALYMPPDAGLGMLYSLLFVVIARAYSLDVYLHHRSFKYISRKNGIMTALVAVAGGEATHVFLCADMRDRFIDQYGRVSHVVVSNALHVRRSSTGLGVQPQSDGLRIGFMSNLSVDKGLDEVISTYEECKHLGIRCRLILGGPFVDGLAEAQVHRLVSNDVDVTYAGFVSDKAKFFGDLDVFLFPTRYANEAQPNVLFEANSYGVPVITVDRGCILSDMGPNQGFVVSLDEFPARAAEILLAAAKDPVAWGGRKQAACADMREAAESSYRAYEELLERIKASCYQER